MQNNYPLNENNQYPLVRKCVEKMFASRTKPMSEKTIEVWIEELISYNFTDSAIKKATQEFVENEEYNLSLPVVLNLVRGNFKQKVKYDVSCPFCYGTGIVGSTLAFDLEGKLIDSASYALNCYCNKNGKNLQVERNEKTHHKTYAKGMYFRVFKDISEQEKYLEQVRKNEDKDILN